MKKTVNLVIEYLNAVGSAEASRASGVPQTTLSVWLRSGLKNRTIDAIGAVERAALHWKKQEDHNELASKRQ